MTSPSARVKPGDLSSHVGLRRVRLWHFIVLPALGMGAVLLLSRLIEPLFAARLGPLGTEVYQASRAITISVLMASLIAWLAIRYRRQYESQLHARAEALEKTRDFLASIIEGSGEAIVTLDSEDRVNSWNRAAERIFGWTTVEMMGEVIDRMLPDDPGIVEDRRRVGRALRAGRTVRDHQTTRVRKDGRHIVVRITWSPLQDYRRGYAGCIGIVLDVTAENEMRERLFEHERLAAVGELAATVAHEVRNPLAGIRGACELICSGRADENMKEEISREVMQQIDRLNRTVTDLLQFANPRAMEPQSTDLNGLIDRVVGMLREDPKAAGVKLVRGYGSALPELPLDRGQMEQVFYNILLNASQVMEFDGTITVTTELEAAAVKVTVLDNGPGIAAEMLDRMFKPFVSSRVQGTGLGLAIVRKIVLAHNGSIEASNVSGGGAEFRLRLPLKRVRYHDV